jgi:uncharacterized protein (TIGR02001 family)
MHFHVKRSLLAAAALALAGGAAQADGISANLSLVSKYKYRGQDQSDGTKAFLPAVQGGFDYALEGFYVGNWNSSVGFGHGTEMDFYGGYKGEAAGFGYDVGVLQYYYPGSDASHLNTTELYIAGTWAFLTAKYSHTVSSKYFGIEEGQNTGYFDLSANYAVAEKLTLNGHVGATVYSNKAQDLAGSLPNYWDWKLGATYDLGNGFSVAGAAVGATEKDFYGDINKTRLVVSLTKAM